MNSSDEEIPYLGTDSQPFPDVNQALSAPNGLLAFGGDLSETRLINAYRQGIFPWFDSDEFYVHWWSPNPRAVLFPDELHVSRSMKKLLRQNKFRVSFDTDFAGVISLCASVHSRTGGTWITQSMQRAYEALFHKGLAHSVEVRDKNNLLVGGLYGVSLGRMFFGESMFSVQANTSKVALLTLVRHLHKLNFVCLDCQMMTNHLKSLGARNIRRKDFVNLLQRSNQHSSIIGPWTMDDGATANSATAGKGATASKGATANKGAVYQSQS